MKRSLLIRLLAFATSVAMPIFLSQARAGGIGDGGGEQITAEANPWRLGPAPIEYCIERSSDFPQSKQELSVLVAEVFHDWEIFFHKYHMDGFFQHNAPNMPPLTLPLSAHELNFCSDKRSQIRFEFGVMNTEMRAYKAQYADRVLGFARRTNYDNRVFLGSDVVWIAPQNFYEEHTGTMINRFPDWTWRASLKHQLLHEVGHVFGMQHNSTWVMDSETMHVQLWATLRHQSIPNESNKLVPLGSIETSFSVFDPLSGLSEISTCLGFQCLLARPIPAQVLRALNIQLPVDKTNPEVKVRFSQQPFSSNASTIEQRTPIFKMTILVPSLGLEKTIDIQPQVLSSNLVPRVYISGAYNLTTAWLRRVYTGNFNAVLTGNGTTVPLMLTVAAKLIKLSIYDSASASWSDWFALSAPYVDDPQPIY